MSTASPAINRLSIRASVIARRPVSGVMRESIPSPANSQWGTTVPLVINPTRRPFAKTLLPARATPLPVSATGMMMRGRSFIRL